MTEPTTEAGSGMLATALRLIDEQGAVYLMGQDDLDRERAQAVNAALDKVAADVRAIDLLYEQSGDSVTPEHVVTLAIDAIEAARPKP